jgi:hypothetical protein
MEEPSRTLRKRIINTARTPAGSPDLGSIDITAVATVIVTSEDPVHPIDHVFNKHNQTEPCRWIAANPGEQCVILEFDKPQTIHQIALEIEERDVQRSQELTISISSDGGRNYQELIRQEYNFSPPGTTWERETWSVPATRVSHLCLQIKPDKSGKPCRATLTSLLLR